MPMINTVEILAKKRDGKELTWEEYKFFIDGALDGTIKESQTGALLMASHLQGMTEDEVEILMRVMMFSGNLLVWPRDWVDKMASLQSIGSTGNKAKLILAPAMAACGLKFPILSSRGGSAFGSVLSRLSSIPGFDGSRSLEAIHGILETVGCCVVQQPGEVAPAEKLIRDVALGVSVGNNDAFKEACMVARVGALKLNAIVMEIPYGPGEAIKTKTNADKMAQTLTRLSKTMGIKCHVVMTAVATPVGQNVGQSLDVAEAIKCLHGDGPSDLHDLVCTLGGHILREAGVVDNVTEGEEITARKLKDGSARKKFGEMLQAQGVEKADVKVLLRHKKEYDHIWTVLPASPYFTHLSTREAGYIHYFDIVVLNEIIMELVDFASQSKKKSAGGIQLLSTVGSYHNTGELWAKIHHNTRLKEDQIERLNNAITLRSEPPETDKVLEISELTLNETTNGNITPL